MRTINNTKYTFTFVDNGYRVINISNLPLNIEVFQSSESGADVQILSTVVAELTSYDFTLLSDGRYKLKVANQPLVYFTHFLAMQNYIIDKVVSIVCTSCCVPCADRTINCLEENLLLKVKQQSILTALLVYARINKSFSLVENEPSGTDIDVFLNKIYSVDYYRLQRELATQLTSSVMRGDYSQNEVLFKYNVAMLYLALYTEALEEAITVEDQVIIKDLYKITQITPCLTKLGISVDSVQGEQDSQKTRVYYWQIAPTETIADVLPLLTKDFLATKPSASLETFTDGCIVPLTSYGHLVFAISPIDNSSFVLRDSLGNDVTDNFVVDYNTLTSSAIFVSNLSYSHSNIYFDFKPIL